MGSFKKALGNIMRASAAFATGGASELIKEKKPKVAADTGDLQEEAKQTAKQRQALFMTEGGILGEEVEGVAKKKRGTILGN